MSAVAELASLAKQRSPLGVSYAGEVSPREAYEILLFDKNAVLVDVRTDAEWAFSGVADLTAAAKKPLLLSWRLYPDFSSNPQFLSALKAQLPHPEAPVFFLCKTGGRSSDAANAMAKEGYTFCFNVSGGFEGDANEDGQRGKLNGWKAEALPWRQA
ncbi:MAG: rhodanese-like domain-containing protein [Rickettsiales bacterium]|nr:rhodanese-like domain-containing protein [Rickettsiales bacterium]